MLYQTLVKATIETRASKLRTKNLMMKQCSIYEKSLNK
ncbi:hypothetical protein JCM19233_5653 [Vibrio astriarenae]|nr:hypothetical protein JCM19233_5653 [Vibrio sp. C7]